MTLTIVQERALPAAPVSLNQGANDAAGASFAVLLTAQEPGALSADTYTAAEPAPIDAPAEALKQQFREWKTDYLTRGISEDRRAQVVADADEYERILEKIAAENGYDRPLDYVNDLSSEDLDVLRRMHCLADTVHAASLTEEGALNLLLPPGQSQDIDHDGFQMVGAAKMWTFPPVNAPQSVRDAWKETTKDMSEKDILLLQGSFLPSPFGGSAYIEPDASYADIVSEAIEGANFSRKFDQPWQVENRNKQIAALELLLSNLRKYSAL